MLKWVRRLLSHPRADVVILAIGTLLSLPAIPTGIAADDYIHQLALRGTGEIPGLLRFPLDLFHFATPHFTNQLMNEGVLPWWTDPEINFAFFRPLSSATHLFDYVVLGNSAPLMHVHTIFWATVVLLAARAIYRTVHGAGWVAVLALALYTLDDARGTVVAWLANRNAFVACGISAWAFYLYVRGRAGGRAAAIAAPVVYGASLLASEGALAITPYLFAHALFVERGSVAKRFVSLLPFAVITLAWALVYRALGYGIAASGVYFDPLLEPSQFLRTLPERFTMLWFAQLGGPRSELWNGYSVLFPGVEVVVAVVAIVTLAVAGLILVPTLRRDPVARFWLLGAALATLPSCSAFPADRLLPWVSLGAMGLLARFVGGFVESPPPTRFERTASRAGAALVIAAHLVLGPLAFPFRAIGTLHVRGALDRAEQSVPSDPSVTSRDVVLVNPPADPFASYIPVTRAVKGTPRGRSQLWLADATTPVVVSRVDERTLRLEPEGGFMIMTSEQLFRNVRLNPFHAQDQVALNAATLTVEAVTTDGRPLAVRARFQRPLEDPRYLFLSWRDDGYVPFTPPAVGTSTRLPAADLLRVMYGPGSPITQWLRTPR